MGVRHRLRLDRGGRHHRPQRRDLAAALGRRGHLGAPDRPAVGRAAPQPRPGRRGDPGRDRARVHRLARASACTPTGCTTCPCTCRPATGWCTWRRSASAARCWPSATAQPFIVRRAASCAARGRSGGSRSPRAGRARSDHVPVPACGSCSSAASRWCTPARSSSPATSSSSARTWAHGRGRARSRRDHPAGQPAERHPGWVLLPGCRRARARAAAAHRVRAVAARSLARRRRGRCLDESI